jgi:hypothetical protein
MVQKKGQNDSMLTPVGRLYRKERMVKKKCMCSPDQTKKKKQSPKKNK